MAFPILLLLALGQQPVPQPFPQPGAPQPARPVAPAPARPATPPAAEPARPPEAISADAPPEAVLGAPIYPNAQFLTSYDAGRGQRFYLFGSNA